MKKLNTKTIIRNGWMRILSCCFSAIVISWWLAPFGQARVLFEDNFDDNNFDGWTVHLNSPSGNSPKGWVVNKGVLDSGNGDNTPEVVLISAGGAGWADETGQTDISLEVDATVTGGGQGIGSIFFISRFQNPKNFYALKYQTGKSKPSTFNDGLNPPKGDPDLLIVKRVNGKFTELAAIGTSKKVPDVSSGGSFAGQFAKFTFNVKGNSLEGKMSIKGQEVSLSATDNDLRRGAIALGQIDYLVSFDNVVVTWIGTGVSVAPKGKITTVWGKIKSSD